MKIFIEVDFVTIVGFCFRLLPYQPKNKPEHQENTPI